MNQNLSMVRFESLKVDFHPGWSRRLKPSPRQYVEMTSLDRLLYAVFRSKGVSLPLWTIILSQSRWACAAISSSRLKMTDREKNLATGARRTRWRSWSAVPNSTLSPLIHK